MAGHARYTALLDACVLYPIVMCDALMSLAVQGFYAAKWSKRIEVEWLAALEKQRDDLRGKLEIRRDYIREAIPDWEVPIDAIEALEPCLVLPDPNDIHVLAAAIAGHADCIVTSNGRDFPSKIVGPYGIEVIDPDRFMINQWDLRPYDAISAFKRMRARWRKPQSTPEDFANAFDRGGLPATAQRLREAVELI